MAFISATLLLLSTLLFGVSLHNGFCLLRNYRAACKIGIPIRVIPISPLNPIWMLLDKRVLALVRRLPFGLSNSSFMRYNWRGWEVADRCKSHQEMGDVFVVVSPFRNTLYIADPAVVVEVLRRSKDFPHDAKLTAMLDVFGPNISTALGENWRKQRRITASCFNDWNNELVWSESLSQAEAMVQYWTGRPSIATVADDTRTLTLNVIARAGFGQSFDFQGRDDSQAISSTTDAEMSYRDSLKMILENCILIMAFGPQFFTKSWLPTKFKRLNQACLAFQKHMTTVYEEAKHALADSEPQAADRNLMASLVRASQENAKESKSGGGLTEPEIYGNMFVFNFAGHDTTAHTFTFALYFLAAHPDVQDWLAEEVGRVLGDRPPHEWRASSDFPRLKRCLAVLYETLRLYLPVPPAKWTENATPSLRIGDKTVVIPPQTMICPSYASLQTDPEYWGPDSMSWRPQRWIKTVEAGSGALEKEGEGEELLTPLRGTFMGWSEGARDCPGRKFSQVEFVATIAAICRVGRVDPVLQPEETAEDARKRVLDQIENDTGYGLLIQMLHPERCPLAWSRRAESVY